MTGVTGAEQEGTFWSKSLIFDRAGCSYMIENKINDEVTDSHSLSIFYEEDTKHYPINGLTSNFQESRYTSDYFVSKYSRQARRLTTEVTHSLHEWKCRLASCCQQQTV